MSATRRHARGDQPAMCSRPAACRAGDAPSVAGLPRHVQGPARGRAGEPGRQTDNVIDNWSLWLDVKIALKTIPAVLGRGAR